VATPIGTLGDLSPRAAEVLARADLVAAEDTRMARKLLGAVGIPAPSLVALHAHNEPRIARSLAERALSEEVVLVSDAGTPALSDPGAALVTAAHVVGAAVRSVPGPSALTAALSASGFPAIPSVFLGFPPRKGRRRWVEQALSRPETLVVFESPHRVVDLLGTLAQVSPEREATLCRELSKRFEEVVRGTLAAVAAALGEREEVRGECVVVVGPGPARKQRTVPPPDGQGGLRSLADALAARCGVSRRQAYQSLLELERSWEGDD